MSSAVREALAGSPEERLLRRARHFPRLKRTRTAGVVLAILMVGALATGLTAWTAVILDHRNERRLLQVQTRQAAALVTSAVASIEAPLQTAIDIARVTGGEAASFVSYIHSESGAAGPFVAASLWRLGASPGLVATVGAFAASTTRTAQLALIDRARSGKTLAIVGLPVNELSRIGYALADPAGGFAIYAERAIPSSRRVPVENDSAFAELDFATYLGPTTATPRLATTDVALSHLPVTGRTVLDRVPFGDTVITLVTRARRHLSGPLEADLWWLVLLAGGLLTIASAGIGGRLAGRRTRAESDARTIAELYDRLDNRYGEQRSISLTLQNALLPQYNPDIPGLDIGSLYVAGAAGVEVGGDWFSVIQLDDDAFAFVVGDVSGRGVRAAAVMARMRFTLRAYLAEGHLPDAALQLTTRQLDLRQDGHLATALVGLGSLSARTITVASAGHPPPLLVSTSGAEYLPVQPGRPLGTGPTTFTTSHATMAPGSMLIAYTDGLIERRGEDIDLGLDRLRQLMTGRSAGEPIDDVITSLVAEMAGDGADDDLAVLALRWRTDGAE